MLRTGTFRLLKLGRYHTRSASRERYAKAHIFQFGKPTYVKTQIRWCFSAKESTGMGIA